MRGDRRYWLRPFLLALILLGPGAGRATAATTVEVKIVNFQFSSNPTIQVGDTIHWTWAADSHSTTSVEGSLESWDSGVHSVPFSFEHTFMTPGVYVYYCKMHGSDNHDGTASGMHGQITVGDVGPPARVGSYVGNLSDRRHHQTPFVIRVDSIDGTSFQGACSTDGVNFVPVQGTLTTTGELNFVQSSGTGRQRTTITTSGQYAADNQSITGTRLTKKGKKKTSLTFLVTKQASG